MSVLSLTAAKAHLNSSQSVNDGELQATIDAAEAAIARLVGPLEVVTKTVRLRGVTSLALPVTPAISLVSVTPVVGGPVIPLSDLYLNTVSGTISYNLGWRFYSMAYDVVYTAGRQTVPDDLLLAIKELVRHLWSSQGGPVRTGPLQSDTLNDRLPGSSYTFPIRVTELLTPHMRLGIA